MTAGRPTASPRPRRIGVDLRALVGLPTGGGVYVESLLRELAGRGQFRYLGLAHAPLSAGHDLTEAGVETEVQRTPLGVAWQQLVLPWRLRRGDIDLFWSPLFTLPSILPVPGVVTVFDLTPLLFPDTHRLKVRLSQQPFLARTMEIARRIVVISRATADDLVRLFPDVASRVDVVYPGVDPEFAPGDPGAIEATRRELACPEGYILYSGTLEPRKRVGLLVDVWSELRRQDPSTPPLVLTGPYGWGSRRLLARLRSLEGRGLHLLGRVPRYRLLAIMQAARIFVYPSLYEGFGLPPAEAMACGIPTVVSRGSSLPEVVGPEGCSFRPDDADDLRARLAHLLSEPQAALELARHGVERASRFRWSRAAREMEEIFHAVGG